MNDGTLQLEALDGMFHVVRLPASATIPEWALHARGFVSLTRSDAELSIVAPSAETPDDAHAAGPFIAMRVKGTLDFSLVGILAKLTGALADADVPVFAISTHDTDYLLIPADRITDARAALATVAQVR